MEILESVNFFSLNLFMSTHHWQLVEVQQFFDKAS